MGLEGEAISGMRLDVLTKDVLTFNREPPPVCVVGVR